MRRINSWAMNAPTAERNRMMKYAYHELGDSVRNLSDKHGISEVAVRGILQNPCSHQNQWDYYGPRVSA